MNYKISSKIISLSLVFVSTFLGFACQEQQSAGVNQPAEVSQPTPPPTDVVKAKTPTEAYKALFAAVKAKDTAKIKQMMSKGTLGFAEFVAAQQKQPFDKVFENGFTGTTFAETLPQIRDERVKDTFGAVEVYNQKDKKWEDLPFVNEDGGWRLAIGDSFKGTYKSPGKGRAQLEMEKNNPMMGNSMMPQSSNSKTKYPLDNVNVKVVEIPPVKNANKPEKNPKQ